jgi:hypothetical protein
MFNAPVCAWPDSHFPGQWRGIKDQHNGLYQVSVLDHVISFLWCWHKEELDQ